MARINIDHKRFYSAGPFGLPLLFYDYICRMYIFGIFALVAQTFKLFRIQYEMLKTFLYIVS
jgi:hypothetical protein